MILIQNVIKPTFVNGIFQNVTFSNRILKERSFMNSNNSFVFLVVVFFLLQPNHFGCKSDISLSVEKYISDLVASVMCKTEKLYDFIINVCSYRSAQLPLRIHIFYGKPQRFNLSFRFNYLMYQIQWLFVEILFPFFVVHSFIMNHCAQHTNVRKAVMFCAYSTSIFTHLLEENEKERECCCALKENSFSNKHCGNFSVNSFANITQ